MKKTLFLLTVFLSVAMVFNLGHINPANAVSDGSVTVCKIVSDNTVNPGAKFIIGSIIPPVTSIAAPPVGTFGTSVFTMPLIYNTDILSDVPGDDAQCVTYNELALGGYYYSQESIEGPGTWEATKYNDQFTVIISTVADLFLWDGKLYDGDASNDMGRQENADGHFNLSSERPNRTIVAYNKHITTPTPTPSVTPTPTPENNGGGGGGGSLGVFINGPLANQPVGGGDNGGGVGGSNDGNGGIISGAAITKTPTPSPRTTVSESPTPDIEDEMPVLTEEEDNLLANIFGSGFWGDWWCLLLLVILIIVLILWYMSSRNNDKSKNNDK